MRRLVETNESALDSLAGKIITCFCVNYFYTGRLIAINENWIELENPKKIFETGSYSDSNWRDAESLPHNIFVNISAIEAMGIVK
jgi:hypothetical protein